MLVKTALIVHSLAGALAANTGPVPDGLGGLAPGLGQSQARRAAAERVLEVGEATWYHRQRAPNITASGERYNPMGMTAAHRSIPLGTIVRVTDQITGRSVVVRVNDREPPHGVRCIDLAEGAALALGIHDQGWARVKITEVGNSGPPDPDATEVAEVPDPVTHPVLAGGARRVVRHRAAAHTRR
jgi:rare lipoprotein A (peptidoglycan hydrolase)